jgi:predicted nuclease of predicted toxin-antitoxin system
MRVPLLIDSCVCGGAVTELTSRGWDAVWVPADAADPGDEAVLARAAAERRVLVTLDKDFGALVHAHGQSHAGIIRLHGCAPREQAALVVSVMERCGQVLVDGGLVVASPLRLRIRLPHVRLPSVPTYVIL